MCLLPGGSLSSRFQPRSPLPAMPAETAQTTPSAIAALAKSKLRRPIMEQKSKAKSHALKLVHWLGAVRSQHHLEDVTNLESEQRRSGWRRTPTHLSNQCSRSICETLLRSSIAAKNSKTDNSAVNYILQQEAPIGCTGVS